MNIYKWVMSDLPSAVVRRLHVVLPILLVVHGNLLVTR